jgi:plastocyanin
MKRNNETPFPWMLIVTVSLLLIAGNSWAKTIIVSFGGSVGFAYSPKTFSASVGDTVMWQGSFVQHPLSSTTIPAGSATWHAASGSSYSIVVSQSGEYNYICDLHSGMVGSFTALSAGVLDRQTNPLAKPLSPITAVVVREAGKTILKLNAARQTYVTISMFNALGQDRAVAAGRLINPGISLIVLDDATQPNGFNVLKIRAEGGESVQPFFIAR